MESDRYLPFLIPCGERRKWHIVTDACLCAIITNSSVLELREDRFRYA